MQSEISISVHTTCFWNNHELFHNAIDLGTTLKQQIDPTDLSCVDSAVSGWYQSRYVRRRSCFELQCTLHMYYIYKFYCDSGPYDLIMIYDDILDRFISSPVSHAYLPLCVLELFNTDFRYCNLWLGWSNIDRLVESEIANMKGKLFIKIYCTMQWLENIFLYCITLYL